MNTSTLFRWLKFHGKNYELKNADDTDDIVKKLVSSFGGNKLHHLWSGADKGKLLTEMRIPDEQPGYDDTLFAVYDDGDYLLIIDDVCLSDISEPVAIAMDAENLLSVLSDFYLYLDEIYITDKSYEWFVSVNHHFELMLYGSMSNGRCAAISKKFSDLSSNDEEIDN